MVVSTPGRYHMCMSRTILALALASSVSAYLLPAKVQGRVRGVYAPLASSALLSMRSRPLYMMSIDPDALAQPVSIFSAGFSAGYAAGQKDAGDAQVENPVLLTLPGPGPVGMPPTPESPAAARADDAAKGIKGMDGPLLQALATVCATIEGNITGFDGISNRSLIPIATYKPVDGGPFDDNLDQPIEVTNGGGGALDAFISSFASKDVPYDVIDGITDFHDEYEVSVPPFAALIVQPKDPQTAPILIFTWRGSNTLLDWINDFAFSPTLCRPPAHRKPTHDRKHPSSSPPLCGPNPGPNPGRA